MDELLAFWTLEDYETTLEELEEALITADFGPKTALKIVDLVRVAIKAGKVKTAEDLKAQLKVRGGSHGGHRSCPTYHTVLQIKVYFSKDHIKIRTVRMKKICLGESDP